MSQLPFCINVVSVFNFESGAIDLGLAADPSSLTLLSSCMRFLLQIMFFSGICKYFSSFVSEVVDVKCGKFISNIYVAVVFMVLAG